MDDRSRRKDGDVRQFVLPKVNLLAPNYLEMIDFNANPSYITEPPLTMSYSNDELVKFVKQQPFPKLNIPCHSQNVERHVAETTNAAKHASSHDKRHQNLIQTFESRQKVPTNATKKHFTSGKDS